MKHAVIPMIDDQFNIGQAACARIRMEVSMGLMADAAPRAFCPGYINDDVRSAARETFAEARRAHDNAKAVMEANQ